MRRLIISVLLTITGVGAGIAQTPGGPPPPTPGGPPAAGPPAGPPGAAGAAGAPPAGVPRSAPIERIDKIADNLYIIPGGGSTSLVWVYSTGVLLVDAKLGGNGAKLQEMIRRVTDKPLTHVVLTHHHFDHVGSAGEFPAGVEIVSQENTRINMINTIDRYRRDEHAQGLPNHTFEDRLTLFSGKDKVELYYFGPSHSNGDAVVVFPAARTMQVGDIMKKKELPTVDSALGGSGVRFPATLKKIRTTIKNVDIVVGGHNDNVMSWSDFARYGALSEQLLAHEKASLRAGKTPEQTLADFKLPEKDQDFTLVGSSFGGAAAVRQTFEELQRTRALP